MSKDFFTFTRNVLKATEDMSRDLSALAAMKRYNNIHHLHEESVATHLAYTTLFVLQLHNYYIFDLEEAMKMAITHDLPEVYTSDVPHNVKVNHPEIADALHSAEITAWKALDGYFPWCDVLNHDFEFQTTIEAIICNIADVMSVVMYTDIELAMGNSLMVTVRESAYQRMYNLLDKIPEDKCKL